MNVRSAICWLLSVCMLLVGMRSAVTPPPAADACGASCCGEQCHCEPTRCCCERPTDRDGRRQPEPAAPGIKPAFAALAEREDVPRTVCPPRQSRTVHVAEVSCETPCGTIWRDRPRHQVLGILRI